MARIDTGYKKSQLVKSYTYLCGAFGKPAGRQARPAIMMQGLFPEQAEVLKGKEMSRTDLIADTFTIIRNAIMVKKPAVDVPASNTIKSILEVLKKENYIETFKEIEDKKQGILRVYLRYLSGKSAILNIKRVSKSSLRVYVKADKIPLVLKGKGLAIISTSKGILTDNQARELGLGGEVLGYIW